MITDASDSESDVSSDSETESLAHQAFHSMKLKFAQQRKDNHGVEPPKSCSQFSVHRKKLYDTFNNNSDDDISENVNSSENHEEIKNDLFLFDKKPVNTSSVVISSYGDLIDTRPPIKNTSTIQAEIEVTDLSNLDCLQHNTEGSSELKERVAPKCSKSKKRLEDLSTNLKSSVDCKDVYVNVNPCKNPQKSKKSLCDKAPKELEVMKKCVISDDFEKQDSLPTIESIRKIKKQRQLEREKTKGEKWFHMAAPEITEARKHDLEVLQMRKVLDPKRFYKSFDTKATPKYFQFGRIVETPADFYSSRIPKKQRKSTMVDELLADAEFRQYNKRKYSEIQELKRLGKGPYERMRRLRKKKKQK